MLQKCRLLKAMPRDLKPVFSATLDFLGKTKRIAIGYISFLFSMG